MRVTNRLSSLFFGALLLSGCVTTQDGFVVDVDSISGSDLDKRSYILMPGNKDTRADDLQFKEYAAYVNRALRDQGFMPVESFEEASLAIFLIYGIGDPQEHQYSYSIPTWGQTGVSSSYTTGTVNSYKGYGSYSGTTTYVPAYGITGSMSQAGSYTTFFRFMVLDAADLDEYRKSKKEVQLWKTTVASSGSSDDLRRVFPVLVAASKRYIGKNTGRKVKVNIYEEDEQVIEIKGIVRAEPEK